MKRKIFTILLGATLALTLTACGNSTEEVDGEGLVSPSESSEDSILIQIEEFLSAKFEDFDVTSGTVSEGTILYVTASESTDSTKMGEAVGELINEDWFNYDYVMMSQYVDNLFCVSSLVRCSDFQVAYHVWIDENKDLISESPEESSDNVTDATDNESASIPEESQESDSTVTIGQKNALNSAKDYLELMAFSYSGLIEQLEYEGYTTEEATYAADNCGADWNEQAAKSAQAYLDMMSFSRAELIDQLIYEGFTSEQAEYGATAVGY